MKGGVAGSQTYGLVAFHASALPLSCSSHPLTLLFAACSSVNVLVRLAVLGIVNENTTVQWAGLQVLCPDD